MLLPPTMHSHAFAQAEGRALQHASPSRKSFRDMPKGSILGMSWSMEGARLKPLLKPLGMPKRGPGASGMSGSAVDALCMNAECRPLPKLGAVCRPAHEQPSISSCNVRMNRSDKQVEGWPQCRVGSETESVDDAHIPQICA